MRRSVLFAFAFALWALGRAGPAPAQSRGFQINRYEPTAAGEWSFSVDHPVYSAIRPLAVGLSLNYAHDPLVFGYRSLDGTFFQAGAVIADQLLAHLDLAGSFRDRVLVTLSLPVTLVERGTAEYGIAPSSGAAVGDPRLGGRVRLYGQPYRSALSVSAGIDLWIPISSLFDPPPFAAQVGESGVRVLPKLILGGLAGSVLWSFTAGFYYRPEQLIGTLPDGSGNSMGSELQFGAALGYARTDLRLLIGPEAVLSTIVTGGRGFTANYTSLELLLGAHYNAARRVQLGLAAGVGVLREPGTPDARLLFRAAYAPWREPRPLPRDRDGDGIPDAADACPNEPGVTAAPPHPPGCPLPRDRDGDGVPDPQDRCPDEAAGLRPAADLPGCPLRDQDGDGVLDPEDQCLSEAAGSRPDPDKPGCPLRDQDGDGVADAQDQCVSVPAGPTPDPQRRGCPDRDSDGDGVLDSADLCPLVPAGRLADAARRGCPLPDRDGDHVPDPQDACPDQPGAPSPSRQKNGCPGLVTVQADRIALNKPVFFASQKDVILKKSYPVLDAVAAALGQLPPLGRVEIQGHTDDRGKADRNTELSERRARSVRSYLIAKGIAADRLTAKGYGPTRPIADNKTGKGRARNRRVDFLFF